jgi:hypothetical protein
LQTKKQVLLKSLRLMMYFNILNIIFSVVFLIFLIKVMEIKQFLDLFGNLTLIETMLLLLYGGLIDYSHTAKWFSTMKLLKISEKDWDAQEAREAEKKALSYLLAGFLMFIQMIIIAFI